MNSRFILVIVLFLLFGNTYAKDGQRSALHKSDQQFFIENKGQWDAEILYMTSFGGLNAFITNKGIVYDFYELKEVKDSKKEIRSAIPNSSNEPEPPEMEKYGHMIRINLLGCNEKAVPVGKGKSKTYYNYLIAGDTAHSIGYVGLYKEAVLKSVYEDIDMHYYFEGDSLRYDYILKPGANASQIKMQLEGSEHSYINSDGEWIFTTRFGEVKNTKLLSYQIIDGEKKEISSKFKKDTKGNITFELGAYDDTKDLVIDPLVYSTFIGSYQAYDYCTSMALNDSNQVYITGHTNVNAWGGAAAAYPLTPGAYFQNVTNKDATVISKFSADGSTLLFSTYFGQQWPSNTHTRGIDITLGFDMSINVIGHLDHPSGDDSYHLKLSADGSSLIFYHVYYGLPFPDCWFRAIKVDKEKNSYYTGNSIWAFPPFGANWPYPALSDTFFHDTLSGNIHQAFVVKIDSNNVMIFSANFGLGYSSGKAIAIDSLGNVYVTGYLHYACPYYPYPTFFDSTFNGGPSDVFLAKFNANGVLLYFSYLGGNGAEWPTSIQLDPLGNIYVLGYTTSTNFPTTMGCLNNLNSGGFDIFISKFDSSGVNLLYSTYFGGTGDESSTELQVDTLGQMYFSGLTDSATYPITFGCYDDSYNGFTDLFVTKLNAAGDSVLYSTFLGGYNTDLSAGLALDKLGDVYVGGSTLSGNSFPTTLGSYSQTPYGDYDIFVSKLKLTPCPAVLTTATSNAPLCVGGSLNLISTMTGGVLPYTYHWYGPNGFTSGLQNPIINTVSMVDSGLFSVMIVDAAGCNSSSSTNVIVEVCSGIQENTAGHTILIFPNPNNGTFTLQTSKLGSYELLDVAGRIIHTYEVNSSPYTITEKLSSGMYFIREKVRGGARNHRVAQKIMIE